ncbi:hypothetical protein ACFL2E_01325 [Thermodesulfobacteriota bacterium]
MANREKVILLLMMIVIAYGGYAYFFNSGANTIIDNSKQNLSELKNFVIGAATNLSNEYISAADRYIIDQAEKIWPQDPFLQAGTHLTSEPFEASAEVTVQTVQISYTGFLQTSDALIAIVNGTEYETGDQLNETGYYVKRILPAKIVLGIENNPDTIILPLDEPVNMSLEEKE